jgi:GNAT superfamily N-acetyltransferase
LSRVLARLERRGLVSARRSRDDRRRRALELTEAGRSAFRDLDARSTAHAAGLLAPLSAPARRRLVSALRTIEACLDGERAPASTVLRPPRPGDLGWIIESHARIYAQEYGWDETFEALVAGIVAEYARRADPRRESAWIAEADGERAGSILCMRKDDETAQLRLLLVEPWARGRGLGSLLVEECVRFARAARYARIELWTNDVLVDARRLYERAGFALVSQERHRSFGHDLTGQVWELDLRPPARHHDAGERRGHRRTARSAEDPAF